VASVGYYDEEDYASQRLTSIVGDAMDHMTRGPDTLAPKRKSDNHSGRDSAGIDSHLETGGHDVASKMQMLRADMQSAASLHQAALDRDRDRDRGRGRDRSATGSSVGGGSRQHGRIRAGTDLSATSVAQSPLFRSEPEGGSLHVPW